MVLVLAPAPQINVATDVVVMEGVEEVWKASLSLSLSLSLFCIFESIQRYIFFRFTILKLSHTHTQVAAMIRRVAIRRKD